MVILSTSGQFVTLPWEVLVLSRARLLERYRLEVTSGDGFAIVPADLQCADTHCMSY